MNAMWQAVRLRSMAVTRKRRRISGGQASASDKIIAPAPQAGSQTVIGPSVGKDSRSPSVILAIITSRTISIIAAPLGSFRAKHTIDLGKVQNEAEQQEYLPILFAEHVAEWKKVIAAVNAVNDRRAETLWLAQLFLILAILAVALLAILKLIV